MIFSEIIIRHSLRNTQDSAFPGGESIYPNRLKKKRYDSISSVLLPVKSQADRSPLYGLSFQRIRQCKAFQQYPEVGFYRAPLCTQWCTYTCTHIDYKARETARETLEFSLNSVTYARVLRSVFRRVDRTAEEKQ